MKTEVSSGGVVVAKKLDIWHVLVIRDMNNTWTFPKGLIEPQETAEDAAMREVKEETGVSGLSLIAPLDIVRYTFRRNGIIHKTVHYFLFRAEKLKKPTPQVNEGIRMAQWVPLSSARDLVGYPKTNRLLLVQAENVLFRK